MGKRRRHEARERAYRQACRSLLNCYIRELGGGLPALCALDPHAGAFAIRFPASGAALAGRMRYSPIGEHEYDSIAADGGRRVRLGELARWIAREIRRHDPAITDAMEADFRRKIANSCRNVALFLEHNDGEPAGGYLASEQSLLFGHPFHPFPKSTLGFSAADVRRYAPELRASFPLCYIAVRREIFAEEWLAGSARIEPHGTVLAQARAALGARADDYGLLPVHPWQYERVQALPAVAAHIRAGRLVPLGSCGPTAWPTSSVRTVYVPAMRCNIKLPLDMQITNLQRNNTREQMRRTMDAADYLRRSGCFAREPHTQVACEEGVQSCRLGDEALEALLTVAYRPVRFDPEATYVLASLAEAPARSGPSRLSRLLGRNRPEDWLRRYLDISLLPIVRIAEEKGIHFEAHLQNSLLTVRDGMPDTFIIRDLEGVSVERDKAADGADTAGPLFYAAEQARSRTAYYFVINHLGSLIHALARDTGRDEARLWSLAREALARAYAAGGGETARYLLTADAFLAKRNLTSCLAGSGETPSFAPVRNLMRSVGSERVEINGQLV